MRRTLIVVLLIVALAACSSTKKAAEFQVRVDFDEETDFSAWKTYRFATFSAEGGDDSSYRQINESLRRSIEQNLDERGYERIEDGAPDFRIAFEFGSRGDSGSELERRYANDVTLPENTTPTKTNTLVVKMLDPESGETLWNGRVSGFSLSTFQHSAELRGAVWRLFAEFPPITR